MEGPEHDAQNREYQTQGYYEKAQRHYNEKRRYQQDENYEQGERMQYKKENLRNAESNYTKSSEAVDQADVTDAQLWTFQMWWKKLERIGRRACDMSKLDETVHVNTKRRAR